MKRMLVGAISGVVLLGFVGATQNSSNSSVVTPNDGSAVKSISTTAPAESHTEPEPTPACDGITVTSNCDLKGVKYKTYIYHPAVAEKSHTEKVTSYEKQVTGYCTLCNDGTYSPSCATGRGACSWHGGVAQWNAPRYSSVPVYTTKTVIDSPAKKAYYEKFVAD